MSETIIVAIMGFLSGIILEIVRQVMTRTSTREEADVSDDTSFRKDLLEEVRKLKDESNTWQTKYLTEHDARVRAEWQLEANSSSRISEDK